MLSCCLVRIMLAAGGSTYDVLTIRWPDVLRLLQVVLPLRLLRVLAGVVIPESSPVKIAGVQLLVDSSTGYLHLDKPIHKSGTGQGCAG